VPASALEAYKAHSCWNQFSNIEAIPGVGYGDVNGDGDINVSDVTQIINAIVDNQSLDSPWADVNGDGVVNIADLTALIKALLKKGEQ
jgi:hypothetical protein